MYNNNQYEGYIYKITNKSNNKIYIGQTSLTVEKRWKHHISMYTSSDTALYKAMRKYGIDNFSIETIDTIVCPSELELHNKLNESEINYIKEYDSTNYKIGYNMTIGGDNPSERFKRKIKAYDKECNIIYETNSVVEMCNITGIKQHVILSCCQGETIPKITNLIFRYAEDDFDKYPVYRDKYSQGKEVYCFDLNGELLNKYRCAKEASELLDINIHTIYNAIINNYSINDTYYFSFTNEFKYKRDARFIAVDVYDLERKYINSYSCIADAVRDLLPYKNTYTSGTVHKCCRGESESAFGYIWRYQGDSLDDVVYKKKKSPSATPIIVVSPTGEEKIYESQRSAATELNLDYKRLNACLKKGRNYNGYTFSYCA